MRALFLFSVLFGPRSLSLEHVGPKQHILEAVAITCIDRTDAICDLTTVEVSAWTVGEKDQHLDLYGLCLAGNIANYTLVKPEATIPT